MSEDEMIVESEMHDDDEDDSHDDDDGGESSTVTKKEPRQVYLPGHQMEEDESLVFDPSAYHMMHDIDAGTLQCYNHYLNVIVQLILCIILRFAVFELRRNR